MKESNVNKVFNFLIIFLVVSFEYFRMFGLNDKLFLGGYIILLGIFIFAKIAKMKLSKMEFFKALIFIAIALFASGVVGELNFIIATLVALAFLRYDSKKFIKNFLIASIICYSFVVILYIIGVARNNGLIRFENDLIKNRNSLGFEHVNQTFLYFLPIEFCTYMLCSKKKSIVNFLMILVSTVLYAFSASRTGYFCAIMMIVFYNIPKIMNSKLMNKIFSWLFIIFTVLSIAICSKYGHDGSNKLNQTLSLRPYYINIYLKQNSLINLTGGKFNSKIPLDNLYIYLLLEKGIVLYLVYMAINMYSLKMFKNSYKYRTVNLIFLIYGLFESYIILSSVNFILILQIKNIILDKKEDFETMFMEDKETKKGGEKIGS